MKTVVLFATVALVCVFATASAEDAVAASPVLGKVLAKLQGRRVRGEGHHDRDEDCDDGVGEGDGDCDHHDKHCKEPCKGVGEKDCDHHDKHCDTDDSCKGVGERPCKEEKHCCKEETHEKDCGEVKGPQKDCKGDDITSKCDNQPCDNTPGSGSGSGSGSGGGDSKCDGPANPPPDHCGPNCGCHCQNGGGCVRVRFNEGKAEKEDCKSDGTGSGGGGSGGKPPKCETDSDSTAAGTEWGPQQNVKVGDIRTFPKGPNSLRWLCRQSHTTQAQWTPPVVPALWRLAGAPKPGVAWQIGRWYCIGETVTSRGCTYRCRQQHMATAGWAPPYTPALWEQIGKCNAPCSDEDLNW